MRLCGFKSHLPHFLFVVGILDFFKGSRSFFEKDCFNGSCDSRLNLELLFIDGQNLIFYNKSNIALKYVVVNMREESRRVLL